MSDENKEILKKANEAVANGDNEGFLSFCTEDTEWTFVGDPMLRGKEAVRKYMEVAYAEPPKFMIENLIAEGDFVTVVGKISMKNDAGKVIAYDYCDVWKFRGGMMSELKAFVVEIK